MAASFTDSSLEISMTFLLCFPQAEPIKLQFLHVRSFRDSYYFESTIFLVLLNKIIPSGRSV
jgi:hypothetical protein